MEATVGRIDPEQAKKYFDAKLTYTMGPMELKQLMDDKEDFTIIDVRSEDDFREGHIPGSINLPEDQWATLKGVSKDRPNIIYCYSQACHLAAKAAAHFAGRGFPVQELEGGWKTWQEQDLGVEKETEKRRGFQTEATVQ